VVPDRRSVSTANAQALGAPSWAYCAPDHSAHVDGVTARGFPRFETVQGGARRPGDESLLNALPGRRGCPGSRSTRVRRQMDTRMLLRRLGSALRWAGYAFWKLMFHRYRW